MNRWSRTVTGVLPGGTVPPQTIDYRFGPSGTCPGASSLDDLPHLGGDRPVLLVDLEEPLGPLQCLSLVLGPEDGVSTDDFLALGEGPVGVAELAPGPGDPGAFGGGGEPSRVQHHASLGDLLEKRTHSL